MTGWYIAGGVIGIMATYILPPMTPSEFLWCAAGVLLGRWSRG